jgi:hypothetical protein
VIRQVRGWGSARSATPTEPPGRNVCPAQLRDARLGDRVWLRAEAEGHAKFVVGGSASAYPLRAMKINRLPVGFVTRSTG